MRAQRAENQLQNEMSDSQCFNCKYMECEWKAKFSVKDLKGSGLKKAEVSRVTTISQAAEASLGNTRKVCSPANKASELQVQPLKDAWSAPKRKLHQLEETMQTKDKERQARSEKRVESWRGQEGPEQAWLVLEKEGLKGQEVPAQMVGWNPKRPRAKERARKSQEQSQEKPGGAGWLEMWGASKCQEMHSWLHGWLGILRAKRPQGRSQERPG
ncbi:hypothetical protein L7F22_022577 [Adiantum nelumboides]|nr:hypothetical protein [Adiantum nelumboides]